MSKMGKFETVQEGVFLAVREVQEGQDPRDGRYVGLFGSIAPLGMGFEKRAEKCAAHLANEHAKGRVPQSFCGTLKEGRTPCDHERVHIPDLLTDAQRTSLVFCKRHVGAFGIPVSEANAAWLKSQEAKP